MGWILAFWSDFAILGKYAGNWFDQSFEEAQVFPSHDSRCIYHQFCGKIDGMYDRLLQWPKNTSFLFGPRSTGKSTWIVQSGVDAYLVDLLDRTLALRLEKDPQSLRSLIRGEAGKDQWIVIDEIQKVPALLDVVHQLYEQDGYRKFLLTGSSARKLRVQSTNLLGGRARSLRFFPLAARESDFSNPPEESIEFGCLPAVVSESETYEKESYLQGYVENYIADEIKRESQIRNVSGFQRFLEVCAICSTKPVNYAGIARDAGISRESVRLYYEVMQDTLIGSWLPAFRERIKVKQVQSPKFYFFDSGVLNAAAGYFSQPAPADWQGLLLETWILHELRAYLELCRIKGSLSYWQTRSGTEVDFVWNYGEQVVLIEIKAAKKFRRSFLKGIKSFRDEKKAKGYLVYLGQESHLVDDIEILPVMEFLKRLSGGEVLG